MLKETSQLSFFVIIGNNHRSFYLYGDHFVLFGFFLFKEISIFILILIILLVIVFLEKLYRNKNNKEYSRWKGVLLISCMVFFLIVFIDIYFRYKDIIIKSEEYKYDYNTINNHLNSSNKDSIFTILKSKNISLKVIKELESLNRYESYLRIYQYLTLVLPCIWLLKYIRQILKDYCENHKDYEVWPFIVALWENIFDKDEECSPNKNDDKVSDENNQEEDSSNQRIKLAIAIVEGN